MNEHMTKGKMNLLIIKSYLKERLGVFFLYLAIAAFYLAIAALYDYGRMVANMLYATGLALFVGLMAAVYDFVKYRKRCMELLASAFREEKGRYLSVGKSLPERLYQGMLSDEEQEKRRLLSEYDEKKRNMADYYTMWTHQIKTPIAAMRLLLQDGAEGETLRQQELEELFKIEQYAAMALYFARLDSVSSDFVFKTCDVYQIVRTAVKKYSVLFIRSGLKFWMEEFEAYAVSDEKWLGFVVEQVFSNALKYTQEGEISIYGSDSEGERKRGRISYVTIEDTGIGIREGDLPRIFEKGFTGYNGRLENKSTGIGLYLCDQIMKKLSHTIKVKSVWGQGTKVILGFHQNEEG